LSVRAFIDLFHGLTYHKYANDYRDTKPYTLALPADAKNAVDGLSQYMGCKFFLKSGSYLAIS
jgi:hypothetical protein